MALWACRHKENHEYLRFEHDYNNETSIIITDEEKWFDPLIERQPEYEVIEWVPRRNFCFVNDDAHVDNAIAHIKVVNVLVQNYDDEGNFIHDENDERTWKFEKAVQVQLQSGYANWGFSHPTDEGFHAEYYSVREGFDENDQPCWLIDWSSDGRDCDGRMERFAFYQSKGGVQNLKEQAYAYAKHGTTAKTVEEIAEEARIYMNDYNVQQFESPMTSSKHGKSSQRDHSAEAMGY